MPTLSINDEGLHIVQTALPGLFEIPHCTCAFSTNFSELCRCTRPCGPLRCHPYKTLPKLGAPISASFAWSSGLLHVFKSEICPTILVEFVSVPGGPSLAIFNWIYTGDNAHTLEQIARRKRPTSEVRTASREAKKHHPETNQSWGFWDLWSI